ncbi:DNA replication licensing factor REC [Musca domestica]|uniref:DNA replication licensing factor REC n=1 Tax=Musca domestica TaxID=7370 RepID=A0A9J7HXP1_MUSDO|nr:DNA replication licensing factor REC [Musca domestica]
MNAPAGSGGAPRFGGRGRGYRGAGGGYRPYFFFKRNGRTIPACGRGTTGVSRGRGRGRGAPIPAPALNTQNPISSSFLRPHFYAAPEDSEQNVTSMAIDTPAACAGWRLYFYGESYDDNSELAGRLRILETHFNGATYDLLAIQQQGYFMVTANVLLQDEELRRQWPTLMEDMMYRPRRTLATLALAMHSSATLAALEASLSQQECTKKYYVPKVIKPRKVYARPMGFMEERPMNVVGKLEIDQLYCVRGIVTSIGPVDASVTWLAYRCGRCKQEQAIKQSGPYITRPYSCKREGCLAKAGFIEVRSSPFTRITPRQMIRLTESGLDIGSTTDIQTKPCLSIELRHDLVDTIYLGQEIVVTGILRVRPLQEQNAFDKYSAFGNQMEVYMKATTIVDGKTVKYKFLEEDIEAITTINSETDTFKILVHSLAPEVHGHEMAKAGVLLSLFGGSGSQEHDEEEINVLLVGDPGVGKSNIVDMCSKISQKGSIVQAKRGPFANTKKLTVNVKGRTNYIMECGELLAARNGHCSVDDIDRLTPQMESFMNILQAQTTSLTFPALFSTFFTPTSVIASANSMRGHYDQSKTLTENIRIAQHLLSEFHLVFVLLDKPNKDMDTSLSEHIKAVHAGSKKNTAIANRFELKSNSSMNMTIDGDGNEDEYDLSNKLKLKPEEEVDMNLLPITLMKKFIVYSRQQVKPLFVDSASEELKKFYMELREQSEGSQFSVSTGHLAGLIRLCQARARIDFSSEVTPLHVRDVVCIVKQSNNDMALGDYIDTNPTTAVMSKTSQRGNGTQANVRKFHQILQMRSGAVSRRIFEFDELKDMARRVGISCGVTNIVDILNIQGILLKKGPNMYEFMSD